MTSDALHRLCRNDRAMIRWICGVKPSDDPSMDDLHAKLGICDLAVLVRERRLRWFGHVMRSNGEINRVRSRPVPGRKGPGWPKKTWDECVKQDLKVCGLSEASTQVECLGMRTRSFNKTGFDWLIDWLYWLTYLALPLYQNYLVVNWYLHVRNGVTVAAYSRLTSRSQAKFHIMKLSPLVGPWAAAPAQSTTSAHRSLDFGRATSSQRGR